MIKSSEKIAIISGDKKITFSEMLRHISDFAKLTPKGKDAKTLIVSENRVGWFYALYAIWHSKSIAVPVDATSTAHDIAYIINDCEPQAVWTSKEKLALVSDAIEESGKNVKVLIMDDQEDNDVNGMNIAKIEYDESDTCLICYTSGTTGSPKGVMLSFRNILANVNAVWKEVPIFNENTRTLVLLPLHHVLPLVGTCVAPMIVGCGVAISPSLAAADIMDTLCRGKIAIMVGVPRLWQTLFRGIKGKIDANAITRSLYKLCDKKQSRTLSRIIFKSVRNKMGGNIKYCVSGGAALDSDTAHGLKTLGLDVLEGYGMTETAPIITFTRPNDIRPGCVGLPMPSVEVKLVDGELCARGKNVMQGYYNRPKETADIIDSEGFVHTGDLATIDEAGRVTITGRKKEIIVLSNGKNVNPTEIEEKIEHYSKIVKEAAVIQDGDMLKAIIVPADAWKIGKNDKEIEESIKKEVLQPYNENTAPYKKLMSLFVYYGELPRTRLEKLQRYKLKQLVDNASKEEEKDTQASMDSSVLTQEEGILISYIEAEKHIKAKISDNLETDLALDSLDKVALQGFIEQTFGIKITADQISHYKSVGELAAYIGNSKTRMEVENIDWHMMLTKPTGNIKLPIMATTGLIFTRLCKMIYSAMFSCEAKGIENIPSNGPFIIAPNHQSFLDGPLAVTHLSSQTLKNTYFYAKKDHVRGPIARMLANNHNIIIMDMRTLKDSIQMLGKVLSDGRNLVIFPEGTRTRNGQIGAFKKTFAILSKELNVPVIPMRIDGAYEAWPRNKFFPRRHKITVEYLKPILPSTDESYDDLAERVREAIVKSKQ